jgi:hypothetical protein
VKSVYASKCAVCHGNVGKPINLEELRFALDHTLKLKRQGRAPDTVNRPRILIISDSPERIPHLQIGFDSQDVEIASVVFPEEWEYISGNKHDLAVVDVGPALLEPALGNLRASKEHGEIPVLVEQSRIAAAPLAGVLPKYRAMPCSHDEMIRLARRRLTSIAGHDWAKELL